MAQTNRSRNLSPYSAERMLGSIDQANANSNLDAGLRKKGWPKVEFIFRPEITEFLKFVFEICFAGF